MDQDATWYGDRPRPRPHCVRWGCSSPSPKKGEHTSPHFLAHVYCETVAHPGSCWALVCVYFVLWNIFFGWLIMIINLLLHTQRTFLPWCFSLWQRPSSEEVVSSFSGSCNDRDVTWQESGHTHSLACSCPLPGSRIVVALSGCVLLLWSTEYFCQMLCPES